MNKILYIIRGLPGSGKSTFAHQICDTVISADDYFMDENGNYDFDPALLNQAHDWCFSMVRLYMESKVTVAVANTFTREKEVIPYMELAEKYGYTVFSVICENRHGSQSVHDVADNTINKMRRRFSIKL